MRGWNHSVRKTPVSRSTTKLHSAISPSMKDQWSGKTLRRFFFASGGEAEPLVGPGRRPGRRAGGRDHRRVAAVRPGDGHDDTPPVAISSVERFSKNLCRRVDSCDSGTTLHPHRRCRCERIGPWWRRLSGFSIGELSRRTGVPVATLRTWESRYGQPRSRRCRAGTVATTMTPSRRCRCSDSGHPGSAWAPPPPVSTGETPRPVRSSRPCVQAAPGDPGPAADQAHPARPDAGGGGRVRRGRRAGGPVRRLPAGDVPGPVLEPLERPGPGVGVRRRARRLR